jgi:K+ transporter
VVAFFLLRLLFFAAAIYGSLKWIDGSPFALLVGLALAVITMAWQALRLLRS